MTEVKILSTKDKNDGGEDNSIESIFETGLRTTFEPVTDDSNIFSPTLSTEWSDQSDWFTDQPSDSTKGEVETITSGSKQTDNNNNNNKQTDNTDDVKQTDKQSVDDIRPTVISTTLKGSVTTSTFNSNNNNNTSLTTSDAVTLNRTPDKTATNVNIAIPSPTSRGDVNPTQSVVTDAPTQTPLKIPSDVTNEIPKDSKTDTSKSSETSQENSSDIPADPNNPFYIPDESTDEPTDATIEISRATDNPLNIGDFFTDLSGDTPTKATKATTTTTLTTTTTTTKATTESLSTTEEPVSTTATKSTTAAPKKTTPSKSLTTDVDGVAVRCKSSPSRGNCDDNIPRYHYNMEMKRCILFSYSGCEGNSNNFATSDECMQQCLSGDTTTTPAPTDMQVRVRVRVFSLAQ